MKIDLNYFPGYTRKAITFTIDDGHVRLDRKLIDIVKPRGIKGTFNLHRTNWEGFSHDDYRALYEGFEVANHVKEHPFALRDDKKYTYSDKYYHEGLPINEGVLYKTENPRIHIELTESYRAHKKRIANNENYIELLYEGQKELEDVFGKGKIRGFVWPYGAQANQFLKDYISGCGMFYGMRAVGSPKENEDFSLPKDRMAWVYNAYHKNVLEMGSKFDAYEDDGTLKWLCFGVHSHDFENEGNWCDLEEFASKYGNRKDDFYYATNAEIFDYEDAIKSVVITENSVYNPSKIDLYIKINGKNTVLKAGERASFDAQ